MTVLLDVDDIDKQDSFAILIQENNKQKERLA